MMNPNILLTCLPRQILSMMYRPPKPIAERDVILVYLLGNSQSFLKRVQVYLRAREKLIGLPPEDLQRHQKRIDDALEANSDDIQALLELAVLLEVQDDLPEATNVLEDVLEKLSERQEDRSDVYIPLGSLYERQERYDEARHAYEEGEKSGLKLRSAICLRKLPPTYYKEFLVCGISSQITRTEANFDEVVGNTVDNSVKLNAKQSVIRVGFLGRIRTEEIVGSIGEISTVRHRRLLKKLSEYLVNSKYRV